MLARSFLPGRLDVPRCASRRRGESCQWPRAPTIALVLEGHQFTSKWTNCRRLLGVNRDRAVDISLQPVEEIPAGRFADRARVDREVNWSGRGAGMQEDVVLSGVRH